MSVYRLCMKALLPMSNIKLFPDFLGLASIDLIDYSDRLSIIEMLSSAPGHDTFVSSVSFNPVPRISSVSADWYFRKVDSHGGSIRISVVYI